MATGYAQLITALAGAATSFSGAQQQASAASDVLARSREESAAIVLEGDRQARAARQRAAAAVGDIAFLNASLDASERLLDRDEDKATGLIVAQAIASGVDNTGSPLLAELDAAYAVETRRANINLTRSFGARRYRFEAETELQRATDILAASQRQARGTATVRATQAAGLRQGAARSVLSGVSSLTTDSLTGTLTDIFGKTPTIATPDTRRAYPGAE